MPNNSPTIVAAALSDQTLKDSIQKLVNEVNSSVNSMADNFNTAISSMEAKLKSLGTTKVDFGSASGGGTKKVVNDQKELDAAVNKTTQSIERQNLTLDQQSASLKNATKGAMDDVSNSYANLVKQIQQQAQQMQLRYEVTPIQELRMRQHELEAGMRSASDNAAKAKKDVDELDAAIANYRRTMESLPKDQQGFANRQAIQKEINDLTVLRDVAASEQKQWASAVTRLSEQYSAVNAEINKVGQSLIDEEQKEKKVTTELDKQLQKIGEISSKKEATLALKSISSMESSDLDKAEAKLANLKALKDKVKNTDLMSKKGMDELDSWIKYTTSLVDRLGQKTARNAKDDEEAIRKAAEAEKQWAEIVRQRGQAAQETSRKIIRMLYEESQAGGQGLMGFYKVDGKDIVAVRELEAAIKSMQQQYNMMSDTERDSAIGKALKRDIEVAREASGVISAYNKAASGMATNANKGEEKSVLNYEALKNVIKELTQQYHSMSVAEIKAGNANVIVDKLQRTNRELQELQNRMNRPISLEAALRGSERTLDDIAYKMQRLQLYRQGIDLTKPGADQEILKVDQKLQELQRDADKWLSKSKTMIEQNNALGRSWNYMKNRLAFYFTVGASTQFVKNLIEIRSQYEMNERALGILINSAERGTQIFNELSQMALVSPYTLIELSNAAKQLTAYDIAAKDVVDTTRRLADMASAVGVPMERLTYALGQIKAYGYLNSRDARMFANAGIPLVRELSKYYSELEGKVVSVGDVYDRMKKKAIDYNSVMAVVTKMTDEGGKFFDFQAKMADTLKVRLANLNLAWNNMLNDMGQNTQGVLTTGIGALRDLFLHWKDIENAMQKVIWAFGLWKAAQAIGLIYIGELNTKMGAQILLGKKLGTTLASAAASTKSFVSGYAMAASALLMVIADIIVTSQRNAEEIQRINKTIADGAKEASESMYNFIHSTEMVSARMSAMQGKLSATDATKTWEALREQIELSAMSNKQLIDQLLLIPDMNKRVSEAFTLAESIQEATNKLIGLDNELKVTQDSILWGLFGEGLAEDIDDFNARLERSAATEKLYFESTGSLVGDVIEGFKGFFSDMKEKLGSSREEAEREIRNFAINAADAIREELGEEGLRDKVQINEAVARALQAVEQTFPQIRGKGKVLFETMFNDIMATEFEGSVDRQAYYYNKFLEQLKKDHGSAFGDVTDEVLKDTHQWSSAQLDAINKTADKLKEDLPAASQDAIDKILDNLNKTEFKVRIVAEMATTSLDNVQKEFRKKFIEVPVVDVDEEQQDALFASWNKQDKARKKREEAENANMQKYGTLMRKNSEDNVEYEQRIRKEKEKNLEISKENADIIEKNADKQGAYSESVVADAKIQKDLADDRLKAIKEIEDAGGYDFTTKSERSSASKAQKAAETELQKALKEELQLIDKVRSQYKKLTDAGVSRSVAMKTVTEQFGDSIAHINAVLGKNGLPKFDIKSFAGTDNPHEMMVMLKKQIDSAKKVKNIKPEEIKELEIKYSEIKVDAEAYDATKIKKGLDNELGRLKDEYELAVELDANPELGNMFADMFDIDLDTLPRTAKEYAERYTKSLNKYFKAQKANIELPNMLNLTRDDMAAFQEQFDSNQLQQVYFDLIQKGYEATQEARKKESTEAIKEYEKLLQKYSEYQHKLTQIAKTADNERKALVVQFGTDEQKEQARKIVADIELTDDPQKAEELRKQLKALVDQVVADDKVKIQLKVAIDTKQAQESAKASFEEFQKSPEWVIATGDLAGLTDRAIGGLIKRLEEYKKKSKNLDPKQIKRLNDALRKLYKQQREGNPFAAIPNMLDQAKQRMEDIEPELKSIMSDIIALEDEIGDGEATEEQAKTLEELKKRWKDLAESGNTSATEWVNAINSTVGAVKAAVGIFDDLAKAIGGVKGNSDVDKIFGIIEKAGTGAQIGASFSGYGAIIGAVVGAAAGVISEFADEWSGNAGITASVQESEHAVKHLEMSFIDLEQAIDRAYGTAVIGARQAALANKELQLAEIQRQIQLEKSRKSKNRDEDKILDLQKQYRELYYEIQNGYTEIIDDLMGTDVASFAENLVSSMISAFKQGEDYMKVFSEKFDEMIDNMIMKSIVSRVVSQYMDALWDDLDARINDRTKDEADALAKARNRNLEIRQMSDEEVAIQMATERYGRGIGNYNDFLSEVASLTSERHDEIDAYRKAAEEEEKAAQKRLDAASAFTNSDIDYVMEEITNIMPELGEKLKNILGEYYKFGESSEQNLSALQQGIQGITEDTAGALEAYMNGVSQQVYLHSELLTQIRDAVVGLDLDVQVATMSQLLLQMQTNYTVMMSMQSMMENWTVPSGQGIRVELMS